MGNPQNPNLNDINPRFVTFAVPVKFVEAGFFPIESSLKFVLENGYKPEHLSRLFSAFTDIVNGTSTLV